MKTDYYGYNESIIIMYTATIIIIQYEAASEHLN